MLGKVTDTTDEYRPKKLNALAPDLRSGLQDVEVTSKELGLRECAANDEHTWVPDAMRAPVYAQQLSDLISKAEGKLAKLKPPQWADREAGRYVSSLPDFTGLLDEGARLFSRGAPTLDQFTAFRKKLDRAARADSKGWRRLYRAVGALPTRPGGKGGGRQDDEPADDDSQAA